MRLGLLRLRLLRLRLLSLRPLCLRLGMRCELRRLQRFLLDVPLNLVRELRLLRLLLALRVVLLFDEALDRHAHGASLVFAPVVMR